MMCSTVAPGGGSSSQQDDTWIRKHRFGLAEDELAANFPFKPYSIQLDFMRELYECVSHGKMGLFESPTGTGKTLSMICALVTWMQHAYDTERMPANESSRNCEAEEEEPDWLCGSDENQDADANVETESSSDTPPKVQVIYASRTHSQLSQFLGEFSKVPAAKRWKIAAVASRKQLCVNPKVKSHSAAWRINDECLQLQSKEGSKKQALFDGTAKASGGCGFRCKDDPAMDKFVDGILKNVMDIEELAEKGARQAVCPYYAARDAVSKADFVLVPYSCLIHRETRESLGLKLAGNIVVVDEAHNLVSAINSSHSVTITTEQLTSTSELLLSYINTFQKLLGMAKAATVTSIKGTADRMAAKASEILQGAAQEPIATTSKPGSKTGGTHSSVLLPNEFLRACKLSNVNIPKLLSELKEDHLVFKISGFADTLAKRQNQGAASMAENIAARQNGKDKKGDSGTGAAVRGDGAQPEGRGRAAAAATFQAFMQFLKELSSADSAGRVLLSSKGGAVTFKYVLLDASTKQAEVLDQAHSVVLASGTLAPLELLTQQLCRAEDLPRLHKFTCGHIVPEERVTAVSLGCGPTGKTIKLTHGARDAHATMDECGLLMNNLCRMVPQGLVVFVSSFAYSDSLRHRWRESGLEKQLMGKKQVFWEARDSADCDSSLKQYQAHLRSSPTAGAVIFCVVGGKLSEGINFGDELARCVVVMGLPYPDLSDPELNERLMHADRRATTCVRSTGGSAGVSASAPVATSGGGGGVRGMATLGAAGREMYSNMCMQAVNQCVGRAIRHAGDYAAVLLVDVRYTGSQGAAGGGTSSHCVVGKLPSWLTRRWTDSPDKFGKAVQALGQFYASMRASAAS